MGGVKKFSVRQLMFRRFWFWSLDLNRGRRGEVFGEAAALYAILVLEIRVTDSDGHAQSRVGWRDLLAFGPKISVY